MSGHRGFSLVELLVVITIIVVLLSLLAPAMDKAIYQAELAVCATRLKGIATGNLVYASDHKRHYPHRPGVYAFTWRLNAIATSPFNSGVYDDRLTIQNYIEPASLLDPLSPRGISLNFDDTDLRPGEVTEIWSNYALWFGFQYRLGNVRSRGMFRTGDRFGWETGRYSVLVGDHDLIDRANRWGWGSHPDPAGLMFPKVLMNKPEPIDAVP